MSNSFRDVVDTLQSRFSKNSTYSYWLKFSVGNLVLDTSTNKNLFISLENRKSGVKKANCMTLNIAYVPSVSYTSTNEFGDINYIDYCIANSDMKFTLQYGYDHSPDKLVTGKYSGLLTEYTKEVNNGMLMYSIKGYSNLIEDCETMVTVGSMNGIRATEAAKLVLETYVPGYTVEIDSSAIGRDKVQDTIEGSADKYVFEYVDTILRTAVDSDLNEDSKDVSVYYTYIVCDEENQKKIKIVRVDRNTYQADASVVFNWMDKTNNIVLSFKPMYNGFVLYTYARNLLNQDSNKAITPGGDISETKSISSSNDVYSVSNSDYQIEKSVWAEAITSIPYTATLITVGIPYEIPILSGINITPLIYGKKDLSAGRYLVTEIVDNIDSGGFTTTMELFKPGEQSVGRM